MATSTDVPEPQQQPSAAALRPWQFYLLTAIAALALVLVLVLASLSSNIGTIRRQLDERQTFINESLTLSRLNVQLAQVLANLAVATQDRELNELLVKHGISYGDTDQDSRGRATSSPGAATSPGRRDFNQ